VSTLTRIDHPTSPVEHAIDIGVRAWFTDPQEPVVLEILLDWLAENGDVPPICAQAIASYVSTVACVEQEITHPDGRVESRGTLQPQLSRIDLAHPRFAYIVASWFQDLAGRLPGMQDDWDAQSRGFRCVRRDETTGDVVCWMVRDVGRAPRSIWSVQIEGEAADVQHLSFALPSSDGLSVSSQRPLGPGSYATLTRAFAGFSQRLGRVHAVLEHLDRVGVESTEEYRQWCSSHGFSPDLGKAVRKRRAELEVAARETDGAGRDAWFGQVIERMHAHSTRPGDQRTGYLRLLGRAFDGGLAGGARDAFRDLLLHCQRYAHLGGTQPVIAALGRRVGNTYVEALAELARRYRQWLRPPSSWRPDVQDPRGQFASLARHLLTGFELPLFMDAAWFCGRSADAQRRQAWFMHLADGGNIRTAVLPVQLTKRMAHCFGEAPAHHTIEMALRRAQIIGQGGGDELVDAVLSTPLGITFDNETFWSTVVMWWVKHPVLDPEMVPPIYDFIRYRKFAPREVAEPGGALRMELPLEPNFSMKSRSVPKLLEAIDAWHIQLAREARAMAVDGWPKSSIDDFRFDEANPKTKSVKRWRITELRTYKELFTEGREMKHCVSAYASRCRDGTESVWSLQVSDATQKNRRVMTIALDPRARVITQVRGRLNLTTKSIRVGKGGNSDDYAAYVARGRAILRMWIQENRLGQRGGGWI
jgi:hypothetical protein